MPLHQLDLDVDARREVIETLERVHRLRRGLKDVDQPLVREAPVRVAVSTISFAAVSIAEWS
jgi:hypothetical protein